MAMEKYLKLLGGKIMGKKFLAVFMFAVFFLTLPLSAQASVISMLHFDDETFKDEAGSAWVSNGAVISSTKSVSGGSSAYFAGQGKNVQVVNNNLFSFGNNPFTIDFWMNPSDISFNFYLAGSSHPDSGTGYDIRLNPAEILVVGINGWGFNIGTDAFNDANYIEANKWYHVMLSATTDTAYLYVDGYLKGQSARTAVNGSGVPFRIGDTDGYGGAAFHGYIDEFRISDAALLTPNSSNPVPEPATMLLFGLGLFGIAGVNRKK